MPFSESVQRLVDEAQARSMRIAELQADLLNILEGILTVATNQPNRELNIARRKIEEADFWLGRADVHNRAIAGLKPLAINDSIDDEHPEVTDGTNNG